MKKKPKHLPLKKGGCYTLSGGYICRILEVDSKRGRAHGAIYADAHGGPLHHYASWWEHTGYPITGILSWTVVGSLPSWEDKFPWEAIHPRYKWATLDADADVWEVHSEKPTYVLDEEAYYSNDVSDAGSNTLSDPAWNLPMPPKGSGAVRIKRPE